METNDNYDTEQQNLNFLLAIKNALEIEINVLKNSQRFTHTINEDILNNDNRLIYNRYTESETYNTNILAQKQVIMDHVRIALTTACPHCWTTDYIEHNGEDMREITYCTVCETQQTS